MTASLEARSENEHDGFHRLFRVRFVRLQGLLALHACAPRLDEAREPDVHGRPDDDVGQQDEVDVQ